MNHWHRKLHIWGPLVEATVVGLIVWLHRSEIATCLLAAPLTIAAALMD